MGSVTGQKNADMGPKGPGIKNDCASERQKQFTRKPETEIPHTALPI
jgi:hypothetical protein